MPKKRILFAAAEISPLAKTGGLGDVTGSLPKALLPYVEHVAVAMPFHEEISLTALKQLRRVDTVTVLVLKKPVTVTVWQAYARHSPTPLLLFKQKDFLSRGKVYDGRTVLNPLTGKLATKDGLGQRLKYLFFSYAVYNYIQRHRHDFNIIHGHDFHVGPLLALVQQDQALQHLKTIETLHNLRYTGSLPKQYWELFQPTLYPLFDWAEKKRSKGPRMAWLGIRWSDAISTVSAQHAKEILTPEYGNELELLLQQRKRYLYAILNGIDTTEFNPATDRALQRTFTWSSIKRRPANKAFLQQVCQLPLNPQVPIVGIVARLTVQKGFHLIINTINQLVHLPIQVVICGTGRPEFIRPLQEAMKQFPHQWHFHNAFDTVFSQYIYGGADLFLMPSRHEPCGLSQLIAMRYGCVPIVRATGGLKDTVQDGYNGFMFTKYSSAAMLAAVQRALKVYQTQPAAWSQLMKHGMAGDYSWKISAKQYSDLYTTVLTKPHPADLKF